MLSRLLGCASGVAAVAVLAACSQAPLRMPPPIAKERFSTPSDAEQSLVVSSEESAESESADWAPPRVPAGRNVGLSGGERRVGRSGAPVSRAALNYENMPLTEFIKKLYAEVLGETVLLDPRVESRRDLVNFRTPPNQTAADVESALEALLRSYGLALQPEPGLVRVVPATGDSGTLPEIRRGQAMPESPSSVRPVFQIAELQSVRNTEIASQLRTIMGERVQLQEDPGRNALILIGNADQVGYAMEAIRVLDQPAMQGRQALRISPKYWSASDLAGRITELMAAEGFSMPPNNFNPVGGVRYPILLLPVDAVNAIFVFGYSNRNLEHVRDWAQRLDQPVERVAGAGYQIYRVVNTSAELLAETLNQVRSGSSLGAAPAAESRRASGANAGAARSAEARSAPEAAAARSASGEDIIVDKATNSLIFKADGEDQAQLFSLLRALDQPGKTVLVEVTIAELRLNDNRSLGVEFQASGTRSDGAQYLISTLGGLGVPSSGSGLLVSGINDAADRRFIINALASNNLATILSTPSVMARSGESANIQVGQEVPVITSQQSSISAIDPSGTGVLQTVQYRNTGVILTVTPTIYSENMVDLEIEQEVSAAQSTTTGVNNSPTFLSRRIQTKTAMESGTTVVIGGLISQTQSETETGIPILKDLPFIGRLFRRDVKENEKNELIVLITPYIINDSREAQAFTSAFKQRFSEGLTRAIVETSPESLSGVGRGPRLRMANELEGGLP